MAETKCAKGRRESVPVGLREKACEAQFIFVLPCRFIFRWRGLLRLTLLSLRFAPEPIAAVPSCCGEPIAFAVHLQDVDMMGEPVEQGAGEPFGAEYGRPFIERQIAGDQVGASS